MAVIYHSFDVINFFLLKFCTTIDKKMFDGSYLTYYEVPSSITKIERYAFNECILLCEVKLPSSLTVISDGTFYKCSSLKKVEIPPSVKEIGVFSFFECKSLIEISIPSSVTTIGKKAFYDCESLSEIFIPSSVNSIGSEVFKDCKKLLKISFDENSPITMIPQGFCKGCCSLVQIKLHQNLVEILDNAFEDCISLTRIFILASVVKLHN